MPHRNLPHAGTSQLKRQFGPCVALYELPWALTGPGSFLLVRTDESAPCAARRCSTPLLWAERRKPRVRRETDNRDPSATRGGWPRVALFLGGPRVGHSWLLAVSFQLLALRYSLFARYVTTPKDLSSRPRASARVEGPAVRLSTQSSNQGVILSAAAPAFGAAESKDRYRI